MIKIAFFDAKNYDIESFRKAAEDAEVTEVSEVTEVTEVTEAGSAGIAASGRLYEFKFFETRLTEDTVNLAEGYDAVCVFVNDVVNKPVIDALQGFGVKLLALRCAGYNNVDIEYAYGRLHIVRVPAYSPYAVAEHAMALLLTSIRRIHKAYNRTREFNFSLDGLTGFDLHGKTVGIVGIGKIGRIFADICQGFGMNILAYDKFPNENAGLTYVSLDEIWAKSDIISFHCPLTEETKHLVNETSIAAMKKGVVLINTSRGALIDSQALLEGIKERKVGAACLDVYEEESDVFFHDFSGHIVEDDTLARLISMPNVIVTSHQAFLTNEALENIADTTLQNISTFLTRGYCDNELCYKCVKFGSCEREHRKPCF